MTKAPAISILLADDDEEDRELAMEAFAQCRLANALHCVSDGEEAMEYLRQRGVYSAAPRPGLVLLDLKMPRKDGFEVLRDMKADRDLRRIPVVVLTTSRADEDVLRSYDLGVNSFVSKPVTFPGLVEAIQALGRYWFEIVDLPPAGEVMHA